jgi:PKD repeat protein
MKTIKQFFLGITFTVFSMTVLAQCPTSVSVSVVSNTNSGDLTVSQVYDVSTSTTTSSYNVYTLNSSSSNYYANSYGVNGSAVFNNIPSGSYNLCLMDSITCGGFLSNLYNCLTVTITNTAIPCNPSFTYYTDSSSNSCLTHFVNTSACSYSASSWNINGTIYSSSNPIVYLADGSYGVSLNEDIVGFGNSTSSQTINVLCVNGGTVTPAPCVASFYSYQDSGCVTTFVNTSTGTGTYPVFMIAGNTYTNMPVSLNLADGNYSATLVNYYNGSVCDSVSQTVIVACGSNTVNTSCQANASFSVFADSLNSGNYFAYNTSSGTGSVSYAWDFGDGTTSVQQYPFHQYTIPGHYVVCLTVTATNGTTTCTDSSCDSSSVQRMAQGFLMSQISIIPQGSVGIKETTLLNDLKTYPNPISDELTIEVNLSVSAPALNCIIIDALGKTVLKHTLADSKTIINTSGLEKGFYFLSISTMDEKLIKTRKLVK